MTTLSVRDSKVVWHPFTFLKSKQLPITISKAKGIYFYDDKGNKYIDGISSWWVNAHGHCHPYIIKKVHQQLQKMEHSIFASFTHEPAIELSERLLKKLPGMSKVFFSDNGSTSVEVALKMAFQYWSNKRAPRTKVIAFKNGYHGDTIGAMSISARNVFNNAFEPLLFDVIHIDVPTKGNEKKAMLQLQNEVKKNDVACFIFEPLVQGAGGMVMYESYILNEMLALCKKHNCISIADEVMTGFGRTGKMFAIDDLTNKPDIICLSKALTAGFMPLGLSICNSTIYKAYITDDKTKTFFHGHSYTGNPTACSAALANLDIFDKPVTFKNITRINEQHLKFQVKVKQHKNILDVRVIGIIIAFEIRSKEKTHYLNSISETMPTFFLKRGIILRPLGNVLYILPPYCIGNKELKTIYKAVNEFLDSL